MFTNKLKSILLKIMLLLTLLFVLYACNPPSNALDQNIIPAEPEVWLISENEVMDGGPGKDGIPALTDPPLVPLSEINYLDEEDLVIGVKIGDLIIAFPHKILDHHEIVNILSADIPFILSYCPLTGSGMAWKAPVDVNNKTYGVSGLLYNSNLILYDRETDSHWAQMMMKCVNGSLIGQDAEMIHSVETEWATWKKLYPNSVAVSNSTGFNNNYNIYPYGNYKWNDSLLFPVNNDDNRLNKKERVHGIVVGEFSKVYVIGNFTGSIQAVNDSINDVDVVIAISADNNFASSFESTLPDGTKLSFTAVQDSLPVVLMDNEGTQWDIFGQGVSGPRTGSRLTPTTSYNSYWFAWSAFFPNTL